MGVQCGHIKNHIGSGGIPIATEIGIRELKTRASEVVRSVLESRSRYIVTLRGKPAALIIPVDADYDREKVDEVWNRLSDLREEVGDGRQSQMSTLEAVHEASVRSCCSDAPHHGDAASDIGVGDEVGRRALGAAHALV